MNHLDPLLVTMQTQAKEWDERKDSRFIFLRCYSVMTGNMIKAVEEGRFEDAEWVNKLLHRFADYYFDALHLYEKQKDQAPHVWQQVHDASIQHELHVLQHLLLGVNAHINYDLVLALYDEISPEWNGMDENRRSIRRSDHELVNRIIAETIDEVQDKVIERQAPFMAIVDNLMGRVDEWLLSELITGWRTDVWNETCTMLSTDSPQAREELRNALEAKVIRKASQLLNF